MRATVNYNDNGDVTSIEATNDFSSGHMVRFTMDGSTAVAASIKPPEGEDVAYADDVSMLLNYVESLPFVQAVTLDEYTEEER